MTPIHHARIIFHFSTPDTGSKKVFSAFFISYFVLLTHDLFGAFQLFRHVIELHLPLISYPLIVKNPKSLLAGLSKPRLILRQFIKVKQICNPPHLVDRHRSLRLELGAFFELYNERSVLAILVHLVTAYNYTVIGVLRNHRMTAPVTNTAILVLDVEAHL
jgi:hypothetical protein